MFYKGVLIFNAEFPHLGKWGPTSDCWKVDTFTKSDCLVRFLGWRRHYFTSYFYENKVAQAVTINGVSYCEMITDFLWPEIGDMDLVNMWFQHDSATCHIANEQRLTSELVLQIWQKHFCVSYYQNKGCEKQN